MCFLGVRAVVVPALSSCDALTTLPAALDGAATASFCGVLIAGSPTSETDGNISF